VEEKEEKDMAIRKEEVAKMQQRSDREKLIRSLTKKACDKNDEALRRLSKN
jgi:hypothetical protein